MAISHKAKVVHMKPSFRRKEKFYEDLQRYLEQDHDKANPVLIMGDMNISPSDLDIGIGDENRKRWLRTGKCSFLPEEREWYQRLYDYGLEDTFRKLNPTVNDKSRGLIIARKVLMITVDYVSIIF